MNLNRSLGTVPLPDAGRDLFTGLIDDARLLGPDPPDMVDVAVSHRVARGRPTAVWLGRLVCPATRLAELAGALTATMEPRDAPWPITVVVDGTMGAAATAMQSFEAIMSPAARIVLAVAPTPMAVSAGAISAAAERTRKASAALSVPVAAWCDTAGGDPPTVAGFLAGCHRSETASVVAGADRVTPAGGKPGIVNLVAAHALVAAPGATPPAAAAVAETDPAAFVLTRTALSWDNYTFGARELQRIRATTLLGVASTTPESTVAEIAVLIAESTAGEHRVRRNL